MQFIFCHASNVHGGDAHGGGDGHGGDHGDVQEGDETKDHGDGDAHDHDDDDEEEEDDDKAHTVLENNQDSSVAYRDLPILSVMVVGMGLALGWEDMHHMENWGSCCFQ